MQKIPNLRAIINRYDAFILDLWGVVHDGSHLYPGVLEALTQIHAANKKIIMLSNAPRRAWKVESVLTQLGVSRELYDFALSSGEAGHQWLSSPSPLEGEGRDGGWKSNVRNSTTPHPPAPSGFGGRSPNPPPHGGREWKHYYYIGPGKDADVLDGLDYVTTGDLKHADFLLNVGFGSEEPNAADITPVLQAAHALKLPMVCLNPDLEVVKQTGERFPCAGVIAKAYEALGGSVAWFGKPYGAVYEECMKKFAPISKDRVLAIGDSLETDIPGALNFGIDCALVTGGILHHHSDEDIERLCREEGLAPTYIMPTLVW